MRKFAGIRAIQFRKWDLESQAIQEQVFLNLLVHEKNTLWERASLQRQVAAELDTGKKMI